MNDLLAKIVGLLGGLVLAIGTFTTLPAQSEPILGGFKPISVPAGGTGFASTSPYSVIVSGATATSSLTASSSPSFGYLIATSTSATSTIQYGLKIVTGGLTSATLTGCDTIDTNSSGDFICGTDSTGAGSVFAWTPTTNFGQLANSTTTQLWLRGSPTSLTASSTSIFEYASSTQLTVTGQTLLANTSGSVGIASTSPSQILSVHGNALISGDITSVSSITATGTLTVTPLTSALILTGAGGLFAEYTGTTPCTNQFIRSLSALGVETCETVANADLANSSLTVTAGSGLLGGGSVSLGGSVTLTAQVATGTIPTSGQLAYWGSAGTPSTLFSVATGTVSASGGVTVTAGRSVIGGALAITCTAADTNNTGCLSDTDWDTFNNKVATSRALTVAGTANQITSSAGAQDLSADRTWTLSLPSHIIFPSSFQATSATTTNATSTNQDITGLLTFNGVTGDGWTDFCTTITGGAGLCDGDDATGGGGAFAWTPTTWGGILVNSTTTPIQFLAGSISATSSIGTLTAGAITATSSLTVPSLTSALTITGAGGLFAEYTGTTCTNQFVRSLSVLGAATCATVTTADITDSFLLNTGDIGTGVYDFGGATSLEIPNGAPTVDADGEIAIDTTSGQLKWYSGASTHIITGTTTASFNIGTSTKDVFGKNINSGTTSILLRNDPEAKTLLGFYCKATSTVPANFSNAHIRFGDNENWTETGTCSTTGVYTRTATNNTFTAFEDFVWQASSTQSIANLKLIITTFFSKTAD